MFSSILADIEDEPAASVRITDGGNQQTSGMCSFYMQAVSSEIRGVPVAISVSGKEWRFPPDFQVDDGLVETALGSQLIARLLVKRGVKSAAEARVFLDSGAYTPTSPAELPDMGKAVTRIKEAIARGEQVTVYGDYDVDGVTGTSVLLTVLRFLGARVDHYIPHRTNEGYGLNLKAVSVLASKRRTKLIISCDCGISNFAEINFARSLGVETIVVDHHSMPEMLPPAVAILHPKVLPEDHPLYHLPGVGVAYKLCEALLLDCGEPEKAAELLDFVTLGMIADMVPLVKENRYLVQIGMPRLIESPRPGLRALLAQVKGSGTTDLVGFGLAPRINAVGRLSDANLAVELITTDDNAVAERLAGQLQLDNARRQELCEKIMQEADHMVATTRNPAADKVIVIYKRGWHHGVVGIVASRLVEKYHTPVFIGEVDEEEGIIKGSARGIEGIDLYEVLKANEMLLTKWGGHKMAAGFSLEAGRGEAFCRALSETCKSMLADKPLRSVLDIDAVVKADEVSLDLARLLTHLAPFGMSNKKPVLVLKQLVCESTRALGKEGKHTRIMLAEGTGKRTFEAVLWNSNGKVPADGQVMDVAFMPEVNAYNGQERLQLVVSDWRDPLAKVPDQAPEPVSRIEQAPLPAAGAQGAVEALPGGDPLVVPASPGASGGSATATTGGVRLSALGSNSITWKDLRGHESPRSIVETAQRKLGSSLAIFSEAQDVVPGFTFNDRMSLVSAGHLIVWQFPPGLKTFQSVMQTAGPKTVYLVGACANEKQDASAFLRQLMGLVRYAVNQREGKVEGERLAAALGATKMAIALGLTVLRKVSAIDWFSEEGFLYLDILGLPAGKAEDLPEFKQLANSLADMFEFRQWCSEAPLKEIQLAIVPNCVELAPAGEISRSDHESDQRREPVHSTLVE